MKDEPEISWDKLKGSKAWANYEYGNIESLEEIDEMFKVMADEAKLTLSIQGKKNGKYMMKVQWEAREAK